MARCGMAERQLISVGANGRVETFPPALSSNHSGAEQMWNVSLSALVSRINRKLASGDEKLRKTRGERLRQYVGDWYILNVNLNAITAKHVDVEDLAREL